MTQTWFERGEDRYVTRGGEVQRNGAGWWAIIRQGRTPRVRGPLRSLDGAMEAVTDMQRSADSLPGAP